MDNLIGAVRKLSANPTAEEMQSLTRRFADADKSLKKTSASTIDEWFSTRVIDISQHTYAATLLLMHRLDSVSDQQSSGSGSKQQLTALLAFCHELFTTLSVAQVGYCMAELGVVAERYARLAAQLGRPYAPLLSLQTALHTLHTAFPHSLTPLHCQFVKLATRAKQYRLVVSVLSSHAIYTIRDRRDGIDSLHYLEWCYYSALALLVYKRWREAADYLHLSLSVPGNAISAVQVAAYKKLLIVSLLSGGTEVLQLGARVTSQVVIRHMEPLVQPYIDLAKAYLHELNNTRTSLLQQPNTTHTPHTTASSAASLNSGKADTTSTAAVIANHLDDFNSDHNLGLVRQLTTHLQHAQLQRLTSTYLTLPLLSLPTLLPTPATTTPLLAHLTRLIATRAITGRIDKRAGLVSFDEEEPTTDSTDTDGGGEGGDSDASTVAEMGALIGQLLDMRAAVAERNRKLALNPVYIAKTLPSEKEGGGEGAGGGVELGGVGKRGSGARGGGTSVEEEQLNRALAASMMDQ